MDTPNQYRRKEDEGTQLLVLLNERVEVLRKDLKEATNAQNKNPCIDHTVRLKYLERIVWVVGSSVFLLAIEAVFNYFSK